MLRNLERYNPAEFSVTRSCDLGDGNAVLSVSMLQQVGQMQQLRNMTMRDNRLITFPEVLCKLQGLEHLNVAENQRIGSVPVHVHHLKDLQTLFINDGCMLRLDDNIGFCKYVPENFVSILSSIFSADQCGSH